MLLIGLAGAGRAAGVAGSVTVRAGDWASNRYTRRKLSDCQHCAGGIWCVRRADSGRRSGNEISPFIGAADVSYRSPSVSCSVVAMMDAGK